MALLARWQSPPTSCASDSRTFSMSGFAIFFAISTFSARRPHVPSMAEQRSIIVTLAPVSSMSCLLFGPICCARAWHACCQRIVS